MRKTEIKIYTASELESLIDQIVIFCQRKNGSIQDILNHRYPQLGRELLIHHVLNAYARSDDSNEKSKLREQLSRLIKLGADPNLWDKADRAPALHRAIKLCSKILVKIILNSPHLNFGEKQHERHRSAVQVCIQHWPEYVELIAYLSERNQNELQDLFLEAISHKEQDKIVYFIKNRLVDFNVPDSEGHLALHLLCLMGDIKLLKFVLKSYQKVDFRINFEELDGAGNTALHYACHAWGNPQLNIVRWLLKNGVDLNRPNQRGEYPLHQAVELEETKVLASLIRDGAKPDRCDALGRTALDKVLMRTDLHMSAKTLGLLRRVSSPALSTVFSSIDPVQLSYERQGFWIRGIGAYGRSLEKAMRREAKILLKRDRMTDEALDQHYPNMNVEKNPEYAYSPSTFVKAGIPIGLFDNDKFGIIIQTPRLIPAWCSGLAGEVKTDRGTHINFGANELEFEYDAQHHTKKVTSAEISLMLSRLFKEYLSEGYYGLEKYDLCISPPGLPYNEGLFRYRRQDIQGIIVCKTSRSAYYAMRFHEMCHLKALSFYVYDPVGQVTPISKSKVASLAAKYRREDDPRYALLRQFSVATSAHEEDVEGQVRPLSKKDGQGVYCIR